jgi:peptide-methionine (R)-S-oxide reductase
MNTLTYEESRVIVGKGTEEPFTGEYDNFYKDGTYVCRRCNNPYSAKTKFDAHCGWPAFDDHIEGSVKRIPDPDGRRVEIECANCGGHLGHVFEGEQLTETNTRHCVNSLSVKFIPDGDTMPEVLHE